MQEISFRNRAAFTYEASFEGEPFLLSFNWNSKHEFWTVTFFDREETLLLGARKICNKTPLISMYPGRGLPKGEFIAYAEDYENNNDRIQKDDFINKIFHFMYLTNLEWNGEVALPNVATWGTIPEEIEE